MTRSGARPILAAWLAATALGVVACGQDDKPAPTAGSPAPAAAPVPPAPPAAAHGDPGRGKQVWLANCVACHHPDPSQDGTLGPAVRGATQGLLEARVLRGEYPEGYKPKRPTKVMPPRPDLAPAVPDLAAFLR